MMIKASNDNVITEYLIRAPKSEEVRGDDARLARRGQEHREHLAVHERPCWLAMDAQERYENILTDNISKLL